MVDQQKTNRTTKVTVAVAMATALAIPAEGLVQKAYYCPAGILSACYGHTGADVRNGVTYSLAQCDAWLTQDMRNAIATVERCAPGLPPQVLAAFGDAVFNMGPTIACNPNGSTAARYLHQFSTTAVYQTNSGDLLLRSACDQLPRWNKARIAGVMVPLPGLTKRRANEQALCLKAVA